MSIENPDMIGRNWHLPNEIISAILDRQCQTAACDAAAIAQKFLPFAPNFPSFFEAGRRSDIDIRLANCRNMIIHFDPIDAPSSAISEPADNHWYLMKNLMHASDKVGENYRSLCYALGKDVQAEVTAYVHGKFVHAPRHTDLSGGLIIMLAGRRQWRVEPCTAQGDGIFDALKTMSWGGGFGEKSQTIETVRDTALYIPGGWWHEVRSLEPSLTLRIGIAERTSPVSSAHQQAKK